MAHELTHGPQSGRSNNSVWSEGRLQRRAAQSAGWIIHARSDTRMGTGTCNARSRLDARRSAQLSRTDAFGSPLGDGFRSTNRNKSGTHTR